MTFKEIRKGFRADIHMTSSCKRLGTWQIEKGRKNRSSNSISASEDQGVEILPGVHGLAADGQSRKYVESEKR